LIDWESAPFTTRLFVLAGTIAAGGAAYFAASIALGVEEARMIASRLGLRK